MKLAYEAAHQAMFMLMGVGLNYYFFGAEMKRISKDFDKTMIRIGNRFDRIEDKLDRFDDQLDKLGRVIEKINTQIGRLERLAGFENDYGWVEGPCEVKCCEVRESREVRDILKQVRERPRLKYHNGSLIFDTS